LTRRHTGAKRSAETEDNMSDIKLTAYSHGAGCGCKISPRVLKTILQTTTPGLDDARLLVGDESRDDAAVYDTGNAQAVVSTTDFFMPIVDDPFDFGRVAAANAISDVYAMGGRPIMAIAVLGWPRWTNTCGSVASPAAVSVTSTATASRSGR
jgi:selenide,water dikinase